MFCSFHIQQNNNLSFLRLSQGAFSLSCKQCATSIFNILITYQSLDSVRETSLSCKCKQCATFVFNILINYHSLLGVKETSLSFWQAVCNFCIQHINNLSFCYCKWRRLLFTHSLSSGVQLSYVDSIIHYLEWRNLLSLSQAVFSSLDSSVLFVY